MAPLLVFSVAVAAGIVAALGARRRLGRDRQLMLVCMRAGLRFAPVDPFEDLWLPFQLFGRGTERGTENAVWQESDGGAVHAFEFWYREREGGADHGSTARLSCAVVRLPTTCPRLTVEPRDAIDVLEDAVGLDRIEMELDAFNRRFRVSSSDRRFAVALLDQRMMQEILGLPDGVSILVGDDTMLLHAEVLPAGEVLLLLDAARRLQAHVPRVVASLYPPEPDKGPHEDRWLAGHWTPEPTEG
jgi:hypothetical protein